MMIQLLSWEKREVKILELDCTQSAKSDNGETKVPRPQDQCLTMKVDGRDSTRRPLPHAAVREAERAHLTNVEDGSWNGSDGEDEMGVNVGNQSRTRGKGRGGNWQGQGVVVIKSERAAPFYPCMSAPNPHTTSSIHISIGIWLTS